MSIALLAQLAVALLWYASRRINHSEDWLDELLLHSFENSPMAVMVTDANGELLRVNQRLVDFLGYSRSQLQQMNWQQLLHHSDSDKSQAQIEQILAGHFTEIRTNTRFKTKAGVTKWGRLQLLLVRDERRQPHYFVVNIEDISSQFEAMQSQRLWEHKFEQLLLPWQDRSASWILAANQKQLVFYCHGFKRLFGQPQSNASLEHILAAVHPQDRPKVEQVLTKSAAHHWDVQFRLFDPDNNLHYMVARGTEVRDQFNQIESYIGGAYDITEQVTQKQQLNESLLRLKSSLTQLKNAYQQLNASSRRDPLTGLSNRMALYEALQTEHKRYQRHRTDACLLFIDVNDFKQINDQHGHLAGDKVLTSLAQHLLQHSRETDTVGRYGGDEIALLLRGANLAQAQQFHQGVIACGITVEFDQQQLPITLACGFAELNPQIDSVEQWLAVADDSMYQDKHRHKQSQPLPEQSV
ncbi:sensor domain-containing diguanylate cyclase [uncultured Ferrimonas sp.]|uniref:GGDEF domain-containing protein n=1 Tax=uncultured Ferrimonas sp. TaxID=432640 RepID=UPI00261EA427|nr:sensor domain-containing diguanylate cyclase [uncultured Ferrimonas sp.]